jgi:hypothetical protein
MNPVTMRGTRIMATIEKRTSRSQYGRDHHVIIKLVERPAS